MKKIFTLLLSAACFYSMSMSAAEVTITPEDDVKATVETLGEGDVLILGDGSYDVESTVNITKSVTIKAANPGQAILNKYQFVVPEASTVGTIVFEGLVAIHDETVDSKYFLQTNTATSAVTNLTLKDCHVEGYGRGVLRATTEGAKVENILIDNCVFVANSLMGAGYAQLNMQKSNVSTMTVKNSTFYNSKAAIFRYEGKSEIAFLFENCTVLKCGSSGGRKMMEVSTSNVPATSTFKVKSCIFSGSFDATAPEKPIDFVNLGDVENSLLEGFSDPLLNRTTETSPVAGSVTSFDFASFAMTTDPSTISGIGDPRWNLNGNTNISTIATSSEIVASEYYNIAGIRLQEPLKGLNIVKNVMADGSVKTTKVYVK